MHKDLSGDLQEGFRRREQEKMAEMAIGSPFTYAEAFKLVDSL